MPAIVFHARDTDYIEKLNALGAGGGGGGATGATGATGTAGFTGATGTAGATGSTGATGATGTATAQTLTDASTVAWDVSLGAVAKVTLGGNRTLGAPTNLVDGGTYILRVIQDGTGTRTLAYNAVFKWPAATAPVLTTTAGAIDILTFVSDGTNLYGVAQKAFA